MSEFITMTTQREAQDFLHLFSMCRDARKNKELNFLTSLVQAGEISERLYPLQATN